ncbi:heme o synthase [Tabrizicola soli]|uniref:Protoheme IX farnesyltransferase n=1 Tax=Tabrizicola soli TaxID=2185115 RepID=A0ABV7E0T6_9RHOB|nr:heme o synthase [Tabrizicola soli]
MRDAMTMTVSILKLRIGSFIALAALVGIMTGGSRLGWLEAAVFTLAVLGASGAAGAFNQYFERDTDRLMARTFNRPFASGRLKEGPIWPLTFTMLLAASIIMGWSVGGSLAAVLIFLGAFTYGVVYTLWLKKRTVWNVVIGGAAGSFALLAGAAAAADPFGPALGPVPILLAATLFLWTPPHFWALAALRQEDYRRAGIPMLPVVTGPETWGPVIFIHVAVLVVLSLGPVFYGLGPVYWLCAAGGGLWFLATSWRLTNQPSKQAARSTFRASLGQFALLSLGVVLDRGLAWAF